MNILSSYESSGNGFSSSVEDIQASSDEEIIWSGEENESDRNEKNILSSAEEDLPSVDDELSEEEIIENDPVEDFITDQDDAFSDVSDFTNKESIHVFSQSQSQKMPDDIPHVYATQEEEHKFKIPTTVTQNTHFIGPESFLCSQSQRIDTSSQQIEDALESAQSIIKKELKEFFHWQTEVDRKIFQYGSVVNAFHNDESVHMLQVRKSWIEHDLLFAKCSMLGKEQVDSMIQYVPEQSSGIKNDTVQEFPEPLPLPPVPAETGIDVDVLFVFSFAMNPNINITDVENCKVVAVWDPTYDVNDVLLPGFTETTTVSTLTRFKVVA